MQVRFIEQGADHFRDRLGCVSKVPKLIEISTEPLPRSGPDKILKCVLSDRNRAE